MHVHVDVIYLDFAKAFDKVDHKILLQKIWRFGFRGKIYNWLIRVRFLRLQGKIYNWLTIEKLSKS